MRGYMIHTDKWEFYKNEPIVVTPDGVVQHEIYASVKNTL